MSTGLHADLTYQIIGAFYDTYNALGAGFPETIYANAMPMYLRDRHLAFEREVPIPVYLRNALLGEFRADLVIEQCVVVELKACERIVAAHEAQLISYLKASSFELGLLFNFGPIPERRRVIWTPACKALKDSETSMRPAATRLRCTT